MTFDFSILNTCQLWKNPDLCIFISVYSDMFVISCELKLECFGLTHSAVKSSQSVKVSVDVWL